MGGNTTTISKNGDIPSENRAVGLWYAFILSSSMTNAKNVYVLLLALIIVLSGCFGNAADDVDADDDDDDYDDADNLPPVISNSITGATAFVTGSDCMTTGVNLEVRHAMTDWDGTIVNAGWDVDLDGAIDYTVTADEGYTTLFMPRDVMIWKNYTDQN